MKGKYLSVCLVDDRFVFSDEETGDKDGDYERGEGQEDRGAAGAQQRSLQQARGVRGALQQPVGCLKVIVISVAKTRRQGVNCDWHFWG